MAKRGTNKEAALSRIARTKIIPSNPMDMLNDSCGTTKRKLQVLNRKYQAVLSSQRSHQQNRSSLTTSTLTPLSILSSLLDMPKAERKRHTRSKVPASTRTELAAAVIVTTTPNTPAAAAQPKTNLQQSAVSVNCDESNLSRGQRKRQAKRDKYLRKEKMILSSLRLKRAEEQSKRIDGLDAMKEALLSTVSLSSRKSSKATTGMTDHPATTGEESKPSMLKSNRGRMHLVQEEVHQMKLVLQHPSFQANPLDTIREHLQNTIQPCPAASSTNKLAVEKVKRKRKKSSYRATRTKSR